MKMHNKLVTVIVPVYKVEKYLNTCVESILEQTYYNMEIILIDDGSPDNCSKLCDDWAYRDKRIIVIHKTNGGLSDARNVGIEIAHGEYISFVDSDDYILPEMIETMVADIEKYDAQVSCVGYIEYYDIQQPKLSDDKLSQLRVYNKLEAIKQLFSSESLCNYSWNKLYKKELFNDIRFPYGKKMEDLGTTYLIFNKCNIVTYNSKQLYYYLQREDSILHKPDRKFYIDKYDLARERYLILKEQYGDFKENIEFMQFVIYQCYKVIKDDLVKKKWACREMAYIWKVSKKSFSRKLKIKYFIFRYCKPVYLYWTRNKF